MQQRKHFGLLGSLSRAGRVFLALFLVLSLTPAFGSSLPLAQAEDGAPTGAYSIALEPTLNPSGKAVTEFGKGDPMVAVVSLEVSGAQTALTKPSVVITSPQAAGIAKVESSKITNNGKPVQARTRWTGSEAIIQFSELKGGDKIRFYVNLYPLTSGGFVKPSVLFYNNQQIHFSAQLKGSEGSVLASSNEIVLTELVNNPYLAFAGKSPETIEAGYLLESSQGAYISPQKPRSVTQSLEFKEKAKGFSFDDQQRLIASGEITVKLPEYTDLSTNTQVRAKLDSSKSKGWSLSPDGTSITTQVKPESGFFAKGYFNDYGSIKVPDFALQYPGAANNSLVSLNAEYTLKPYKPWDGEPLASYQGSATKKVKITGTVQGDVAPLKVHITKNPAKKSLDDTQDDKSKGMNWRMVVTNENSDSLTQVSLIERPDQRLYVSKINLGSYDEQERDLARLIKSVEGVPVDSDDLNAWQPVQIKQGGWFNPGITLVNPSNYKALRFNFSKPIEKTGGSAGLGGIHFDWMDGANKNYVFNVTTQFRDPSAISYNKEDLAQNTFKNTVELKGEIADTATEQTVKTEGSFELKPYQPKYNLEAYARPDGTILPYQDLTLNISLQNGLKRGQALAHRAVAVVLPESFDMAEKNLFGGPVQDSLGKLKEWEIIDNYNNSGKRVLLVHLKDLDRDTLERYTDAEKLEVRLVSNRFTSNETLNIPVYYSFDSAETAQFSGISVIPNYKQPHGQPFGLNFNPNATNANEVPITSVKISTLPNQVLQGVSLVGTDQANLNPYSINIQENQDFVFGLKVFNYSNTVARGLMLYDTLPHLADHVIMPNKEGEYSPRGSSMNAQLTGPIAVPAGYTVSYLCEEPPADLNAALALPSWTDQPADYSTVRAVKIVANEGVELETGKSLLVSLPVRAHGTLNATSLLANSFVYKTKDMPSYVEANLAIAAAPLEFHLTKVWNKTGKTELPEAVTVHVLNSGKQYQDVQLTKANNWQLDLALPRYEGFKPAEYSFEEVNPDEATWVASCADVDGQPVFVNSELVNIEVEHSFKAADGRVLPATLPELDFDLVRKAQGHEPETVSTLSFGADQPSTQTTDTVPAFTADNPAVPYAYELKPGNKTLGGDWVTTIKVAQAEPATGTFKLQAESVLTNPDKNFQIQAIWEGDTGYEQLRPKDLDVTALYKDQKLKKYTLSESQEEDQNWKTEAQLPSYQQGEVATYSFTVPELRYYTSTVTVADNKVTVHLVFKLSDAASQTDKPGSKDEETQTEKAQTSESETQTDTPQTSESGTQTEKPATSESGSQTDTPSNNDQATQTEGPATGDTGTQTTQDQGTPRPEPAPSPEPSLEPQATPSPNPSKELAGTPIQDNVKKAGALPGTGDGQLALLFTLGLAGSLIALLRIRAARKES